MANGSGGRPGGRGYLVQAIVCLLESLEDDTWETVALEPDPEAAKVDIQWTFAARRPRVVQVKSSLDPFGAAQVVHDLEELVLSASECDSYELHLVGSLTGGVAELMRHGQLPESAGDALRAAWPRTRVLNFPLDERILDACAATRLEEYLQRSGAEDIPVVEARIRICTGLMGELERAGFLSHAPVPRQRFQQLISDYLRAPTMRSQPPTAAPRRPTQDQARSHLQALALQSRLSQLHENAFNRMTPMWYREAIPHLREYLRVQPTGGDPRVPYRLWECALEALLVTRDRAEREDLWSTVLQLTPDEAHILALQNAARAHSPLYHHGSRHHRLAATVHMQSLQRATSDQARDVAREDFLSHVEVARSTYYDAFNEDEAALCAELVNSLVDRHMLEEACRIVQASDPPLQPTQNVTIPAIRAVQWECGRCHATRSIPLDTYQHALENLVCGGPVGHAIRDTIPPYELSSWFEEYLRLGRSIQAIRRLENARVQEHRLMASRCAALPGGNYPIFETIRMTCPRCHEVLSVPVEQVPELGGAPHAVLCMKCHNQVEVARGTPRKGQGDPPEVRVVVLEEDQLTVVREYNGRVLSLARAQSSRLWTKFRQSIARLTPEIEGFVSIARA